MTLKFRPRQKTSLGELLIIAGRTFSSRHTLRSKNINMNKIKLNRYNYTMINYIFIFSLLDQLILMSFKYKMSSSSLLSRTM